MSTKVTVLAIESKLFMADMVPLLERCGLTVVSEPPQAFDLARFQAICASQRPSFVFTINFSPEVAFVCSRAALPYVSWTVDPLPAARWQLLGDTDPANCLVFLHRKSLVQDVRALGMETHHLPLAASPRRTPASHAVDHAASVHSAPRDASSVIPISFVGNSLAGEERALRQRIRAEGASAQTMGRLDDWLDGAPTVAGIPPLPEWLRGLEIPDLELMDLVSGAFSSRLRQRRVRRCVGLGIQVWGDDGWRGFAEAYRGPADHGEMLSDIYRRSVINLDIPRIYQRDIVTMRVFDALACGSVVLCEASVELCELFDVGRHLLTYDGESDLHEVARTLLLDAPLRAQLRKQGAAHVAAHHRLEHRVRVLLGEVRRRIPAVP